MKRIFFVLISAVLILSACTGGLKGGSTAPTASVPTAQPTTQPTAMPTAQPTTMPTAQPTQQPTLAPTVAPTQAPTQVPTQVPTVAATAQSDLYTMVQPIDLHQCQSLSAGAPLVFKDYVRSQKLVKIFAHDAKGSGEICRDVFDWGWRVVWTGFKTYLGAQTYALEEADRVKTAVDANPANPQGDTVVKIEVYNGDVLVKTIDIP